VEVDAADAAGAAGVGVAASSCGLGSISAYELEVGRAGGAGRLDAGGGEGREGAEAECQEPAYDGEKDQSEIPPRHSALGGSFVGGGGRGQPDQTG